MSSTRLKSPGVVGSGRRELQFVAFSVGDYDYGINVSDVYGIYHYLPMIPLADAPDYMDGEVQVSNQRVPVVNLQRFAGMPRSGSGNSASWIVMVQNSQGPVGLAVDHVNEVVRLTPQNFYGVPPRLDQHPAAAYIEAVVQHRGRNLLLPNIQRLIHDAINENR
jgi:purine-binding chemotaxis protein CheW